MFSIEVEVDKGRLRKSAKQQLNDYIRGLSGKFVIIIKQYRRSKTVSQLGYFHAAILNPLATDQGYEEPRELKEVLKKRLGVVEAVEFVNKETGEVIAKELKAKSLSAYNIVEMSDFIEKCIVFASKLGFIVKTPEEYYRELGIDFSGFGEEQKKR